MKQRKITFRNVGIEQGSRVWRNLETGVEIIKGNNFAEVGLYYVCIPSAPKAMTGPAGRRIVGHQGTLKEARSMATGYVLYMRASIAEAYTEALLEDSDRDGARLAIIRNVAAERGTLSKIPGGIPGGLCVRDQFGREHVTMRIPGQSNHRVTFTSGVTRTIADVADWTVVADFRSDANR